MVGFFGLIRKLVEKGKTIDATNKKHSLFLGSMLISLDGFRVPDLTLIQIHIVGDMFIIKDQHYLRGNSLFFSFHLF